MWESAMTKKIPRIGFLLTAIVISPLYGQNQTPANVPPPDVVFSNLKGTSTPGGYAIGQYPCTPPTPCPINSYALGFPFTPEGHNYRLTEIEVLTALVHGTNDLLITLYTGSKGSPGTPLESWHEVNLLGSQPQIMSVRSLTHFKLMKGEQYWFAVTMAVPSSEGIWWVNPIGGSSSEAASINGGPWKLSLLPSGAFEIRGWEDDK